MFLLLAAASASSAARDPLSTQLMNHRHITEASEVRASDDACGDTLRENTDRVRRLRYRSSDGLFVEAVMVAPAGFSPKQYLPTIVFSPDDAPFTGCDLELYDRFTEAGYLVFAPQYRGNAGGEGEPSVVDDVHDLTGLVKSVSTLSIVQEGNVFLVGRGRGGSATLAALRTGVGVRAAVSECSTDGEIPSGTPTTPLLIHPRAEQCPSIPPTHDADVLDWLASHRVEDAPSAGQGPQVFIESPGVVVHLVNKNGRAMSLDTLKPGTYTVKAFFDGGGAAPRTYGPFEMAPSSTWTLRCHAAAQKCKIIEN